MSKRVLEPFPADIAALLEAARARPSEPLPEPDEALRYVVAQGRSAVEAAASYPAPLLWVPSTFFAMGTVYATVGTATNILFVNMGLSNGQAAAYSSVAGVAYSLNAFWSPLLELYRTKKFFVWSAQALIGLLFIAVGAVLGLSAFVLPLVALLFLIAIAGATQDIAGNGVYVTTLDSKRQAMFQGIQSMAWNLGPFLATSFLVLLVGRLAGETGVGKPGAPAYARAWSLVFVALGGLMLALSIWHAVFLPEGSAAEDAPRSIEDVIGTFAKVFRTFARKRDVGKLVGFAFFYRFALGLLDKVAPLFLLDTRVHGGLGLDNGKLGMISGIATGALVVGSVAGGWFVSKRGLQRTLWILCLALNLPDITFLYLGFARPQSMWLIGVAFVIEKLGWGFGAVGHMTYMMQQIAPGPYETAHYAFAAALGLSLCMTVTGFASGYLATALGYQTFFVVALAAALPSLFFTLIAPFHHRAGTEAERVHSSA